MVWRVWGGGPPLVLLHGGTGSWMHWIRNIEELARDFTVVAPDIPGSGESASPEVPISADRIGATMAGGLAAIIGTRTNLNRTVHASVGWQIRSGCNRLRVLFALRRRRVGSYFTWAARREG